MKNMHFSYAKVLFAVVALFIFTQCEEEKEFDITPQNPVVKIEIKTPPDMTMYCMGESLNLSGIVVMATFKDGTTKDIGLADFEKNRLRSNPANEASFDKEITVVEITHLTSKTTTTQALTFVSCEEKNPLAKIDVITSPNNMEYEVGSTLNLNGLVVKLTFEDESTRDVGFGEFALNNIITNPENGATLAAANTTVEIIYHPTGIKTSFTIKVSEGLYLPTTMPWPAKWPDNNVWFVSNFVGVEQIDGGNANNKLVGGAWVWAGGDFDTDKWAIVNTDNYSYLHLPYTNKGNGWGAWMFGGAFNLPNEIDKLTWVADIRGKGRWLFQLVDGSEKHFTAAIDLVEDDGWKQVEIPFTTFGSGDFNVSTIGTLKIAAENTVTTQGDFIQITNLRFVKE